MAVQPIPEGYHSLTPVVSVDDAAAAIDFYKRAFGATERMRLDAPDGRVAHAELEVGDSLMMLADPFPQSGLTPPSELGGTSGAVFMYVDDVDSVVERAADAGAKVTSPPEDMFWGDRFGRISDPFGQEWQLATHVEDVPAEEMEERTKRAMASMG